MELQWHLNYPGIVIDARTMDDTKITDGATENVTMVSPGFLRQVAFWASAASCLSRIASKPIGKDLLTLISKRCSGIGAGGRRLKCRVVFGNGTIIDEIIGARGTYALPDALSYTTANQLFDAAERVVHVKRDVKIQGGGSFKMDMAGKPTSAMVSFNPFVNYDTRLKARIGVPTPPFIALAHELVHALHLLSGDRVPDISPSRQEMIEEARTVGAGKYAATRISENAIRAEHGIARRMFYDKAGDCDDP